MTPLSLDNVKALVTTASFALALALSGCASTGTSSAPEKPPVATDAPAPAKPSAATEAPAASTIAPAPAGDMGTVVFFRPSKMVGALVGFKVREGEKELGTLSSGSYFVVHVPAGAHAYTVHSEAKDVLNVEVEPGETYYVQGSISMGVLVGRPNLAPSDATAFNSVKDKLKNSAQPKT